jgi:transposase-like protein
LSQHRRKFSPEFKEEAVRMVIETSRPIAQVAKELGIHEGTLGNWRGAGGRHAQARMLWAKRTSGNGHDLHVYDGQLVIDGRFSIAR